MKKTGLIVAMGCVLCMAIPFKRGDNLHAMAEQDQRLTAQEAIAAARSNAQKPGTSFTILREIVANAKTRRVGDEALERARAHKIELFENGILADVLRSGGFLLAETGPRTRDVIAMHLVSLGTDGTTKDIHHRIRGVTLADAEGLVKATTEFAEALYSTSPSEATSLERRFYGDRFPGCGRSEECTMFAVPRSLLKLGADQNECREVAALYGGLQFLGFRYALSMPVFAASPLAATQEAEKKWEALKAEFLRDNHMPPGFHFDPENIRSKEELQERIDALRRLDKFVEKAVKNGASPVLVNANLSVATISLGVGPGGPFSEDDQTQFSSTMASLLVIYWQRLPAGGFAVKLISEVG